MGSLDKEGRKPQISLEDPNLKKNVIVGVNLVLGINTVIRKNSHMGVNGNARVTLEIKLEL